ncbi:MAG: hypothetical protein MUF34_20135 [Polyangiaceae bacterium]|nr:hypothetical protein [Polyangiaceae bacterium]
MSTAEVPQKAIAKKQGAYEKALDFDESANPIDPDAIAAGDVDPDPAKVVGPWNDAKGRTKRDVAAWLDRVAGELEKGGAT